MLRTAQADVQSLCERALRAGFQVCTHAIGDRGNRVVLDAYEAALRTTHVRDHRFRIEHAQVLAPSDIPRFAQLGVIPSMQSTHQISDMAWAQARLGPERVRGAYAWRALLDTGVIDPERHRRAGRSGELAAHVPRRDHARERSESAARAAGTRSSA